MRGLTMTDNDTGRTWVYVPKAKIKFVISEMGNGELHLDAFRTDGFRRVPGGLVPMKQWIRTNHEFGLPLEVPDEIVTFAVSSERARQEWVEGFSSLAKQSILTGSDDMLVQASVLNESFSQPDPRLEQGYALRVLELIEETEGSA